MSFEARYHGQCPTCEEPITPGQIVEYDWAGVVSHASCPVSVNDDAPQRNERQCPDCFTIHAGGCL